MTFDNNCIFSKWKADRHGVNSICVSPLGNCLLSAGRSIKLWDLETKKMLKVMLACIAITVDQTLSLLKYVQTIICSMGLAL